MNPRLHLAHLQQPVETSHPRALRLNVLTPRGPACVSKSEYGTPARDRQEAKMVARSCHC